MKKLFLLLSVAFMAVSANAQVYVGGGVAIGTQDWKYVGSSTTYKFIPEIGYTINEKWAAGIAFGWQGTTKGGPKAFSLNPYARLTFFKTGPVSLFADGTVGYTYAYNNPKYNGITCDNATEVFVGIKPGVALSMGNHFSLVAHIGAFGYQHTKYSTLGDWDNDSWVAGIDGNNISLSLYYSF